MVVALLFRSVCVMFVVLGWTLVFMPMLLVSFMLMGIAFVIFLTVAGLSASEC